MCGGTFGEGAEGWGDEGGGEGMFVALFVGGMFAVIREGGLEEEKERGKWSILRVGRRDMGGLIILNLCGRRF